jgi:hypothetical protein
MAPKFGGNIDEVQSMWNRVRKETISQAVRGQRSFQEEKILQPGLYGYWVHERKTHEKCNREEESPAPEEVLRNMRNIGKSCSPSQGPQSLQQRTDEFTDIMWFLSYIASSQTGRFSSEEATCALSYMRQAIIQIGAMFDASITIQEAWESLSSAWKISLILGRWIYEPPIPRTSNAIPNRKDRLTALGNGQVPIVAYEAYRILSVI